MTRVLVTGAGGYVGRPATAALLARGFEVHSVSRGAAGAILDGVVRHAADLLDPQAAGPLLARIRPSHLLHLAWVTGHGLYWTSPDNARWADATERLLGAFSAAGGRRFVLASSCAVYDWTAPAPFDERSSPLKPATPYGIAKLKAEGCMEAFGAAHGLSVAAARLFFSFGPGEQPQRLVPSLVRPLLGGQPAPCSAGRQMLDMLPVGEAAAALAALLDSAVEGPVNIASGHGVAVAEIARRLGALTGRPELVRLGALPMRPNEPARLVGTVARLTGEVGFQPLTSLDEGLAAAVEAWRDTV